MKNKVYTLLSVFILFSGSLPAQMRASVEGVVMDKSEHPLPFVNVFFIDNMEGTMTDEVGHFTIETARMGRRTLRISHIGYEQESIEVIVSETDLVILEIRLEKSLVEMDAITIIAGSFTMADEEGQTLTRLDVVTTAGASADIFRVIQTFPGVNQVDEGAGMYVRGGDVSETVVLLDQATLHHPYRYETDTGGYFGMISPFLLSGTYFSSGAFSARYGNALSGVLAMESLGLPESKSLDLGVGLAAISLGGSYLFIPGKLGVRFSGNYSDTEVLFKVNGGTERFDKVPVSWDGNFSIVYKYTDRGQFKLFNFYNQDDISVLYESPSYSGTLISGNAGQMNNLQWQYLFAGKQLVKSSLSRNFFQQDISKGNLSFAMNDDIIKWRTDITLPLSKKITLNTGFELEKLQLNYIGTVPVDENNLSPGTPVKSFATDYRSLHGGLYLESEITWTLRWFTIAGMRFDYLDNGRDLTFDPRISIGYRLSDAQIVKLATGIYHQYPKAQYRDPNVGNPNLLPKQAAHYVVGYEYKAEITNFRIEMYYKDYQNLLLEDPKRNYTNDGYGHAYGADIFLKGSLPVISGWVSYSYLESKRKEFEYLSLVPTDYDINHNFTAVLKTFIRGKNSVSLTYRYTSGKPYTPALNEWNSARLPSIQRLDLSWSYFTPFGDGDFFGFYAAVSNVLDTQNIYGYIYSPDYSERMELKSTFGRSIYFGFLTSL